MSDFSVQSPDSMPPGAVSGTAAREKPESSDSLRRIPPTLADLLGPKAWRFCLACTIAAAIATYCECPIWVTLPVAAILILLADRNPR